MNKAIHTYVISKWFTHFDGLTASKFALAVGFYVVGWKVLPFLSMSLFHRGILLGWAKGSF
jgi:hypothetical protein